MDERRATSSPADRSADAIVVGLRDKRRKFRELLTDQRDQLDSLEQTVERQIEHISAELAANLAGQASPVDSADANRERTRLADEAQALAALSDELDARQAELARFEKRLQEQERSVVEQLARQQAELDDRASKIEESHAEVRQIQRAITVGREEVETDRSLITQLRERLAEQLTCAEKEREELASLRAETNSQRRKIARELDQQRTRRQAEIAKARTQLKREQAEAEAALEQRRAELARLSTDTHTELRGQLTQAISDLKRLQVENDRLAAELANSDTAADHSSGKLERLRNEYEQLRGEYDQLHGEDKKIRSEHDQLRSEIKQLRGDNKGLVGDLEALRTKLAEAEARPPVTTAGDVDPQKLSDLQRRFEMAIEDIREQKRRNAVLEERLANASSSESDAVGAHCSLDWEAQKRRLIQSLESHTDEDDKLSIEGTIRITDDIVARKDREIHELKRVLEEQATNLGDVAVGAVAIADMINQDELLQQERDRLDKLQTEWREKLRQAEIDISLERARMARERAQLDEKLQTIEANRLRAHDKEVDGKLDPTKAAERRWWAKLGMKDHPTE